MTTKTGPNDVSFGPLDDAGYLSCPIKKTRLPIKNLRPLVLILPVSDIFKFIVVVRL